MAKARTAYQDFIAFWYADPTSPIRKQSKAEYAKLQCTRGPQRRPRRMIDRPPRGLVPCAPSEYRRTLVAAASCCS